MLSISLEHDPRSGTWDVGHSDDSHQGRWNAAGAPRYAEWQQSCACLPGAGQFAEDAATELGRAVASMQSRCPCKPCRKAADVSPMDMITEARTKARRHDAHLNQAEATLVKMGAQHERLMRRAAATTPPCTYTAARRRYMETGAIADKDTMLACVTMAEPDLEKLGREWEPKPVPGARSPQRARFMATIGAFALAVAMTACSQVLAHPLLFGALAALALAAASALLSGLRS